MSNTNIPFVRTELHTDVGHTDVGSLERLNLAVDVSALLAPGQRITSVGAAIQDRADGSDHSSTCLGVPSYLDNTITVPVHTLTADAQYRLAITWVPAVGTTMECLWDLDCVA